MTKRAITRWLIAATAAMIPAGVLIPASALALAEHLTGTNSGSINDRYSTTMVTLIVVGAIFMLGSVAAGLMAWVGAVAND